MIARFDLKWIALSLLVVFGLSSLVVCTHGPSEEHDHLAHASDSDSDAHDEHTGQQEPCGDHGDAHFCPCLCHVPVFIALAFETESFQHTEILSDIYLGLAPKGFDSRIERPPKNA